MGYDIKEESNLNLVLHLRGGHCQVPCGIFDDPAIVEEINQAVATIRKACVQVNELYNNPSCSAQDGTSSCSAQDMNQIVRWINTKEEHCSKIIKLVSEYCLCQRVKRDVFESDSDYTDALIAHHVVMQSAMKCKQSVDVSTVDKLEHAVSDFAKMYI